MIDDPTATLTVVAAVGAGLVAGLFFAFSAAVMPALTRRPVAEAAAAMQAVNVAILNPVFLLVFLGTTAASALVAVTAPFTGASGAGWRVAGALLYLVGAFAITAAVNVPLNEELDAVDTRTPAAGPVWERYLARWTWWNHVRTVAAVAAATALTLGVPG